jgi:hypothetical protein
MTDYVGACLELSSVFSTAESHHVDDILPVSRPQPDAAALWQAALAGLEHQVSPAVFECCLRDTCAIAYQADMLIVGAPTPYAKEWLQQRLLAMIKRTLMALVDRRVDLRVVLINPAPAGPS